MTEVNAAESSRLSQAARSRISGPIFVIPFGVAPESRDQVPRSGSGWPFTVTSYWRSFMLRVIESRRLLEVQARRCEALERILSRLASRQTGQPKADHSQDSANVKLLVTGSVLGQIQFTEAQEPPRRTEPILLQVDECARKLDESFVEGSVGSLAVFQPELFQNFMRFEVAPAIETLEEAQIVRVQALPLAVLEQCGDFRAFRAHRTQSKGCDL
jgi:hypothetical protein